MSTVVVEHRGGAGHGPTALWCRPPDGWATTTRGRDTVLWDPRIAGSFRPNLLVRVHDVAAALDLDALLAMVDDELEDLERAGAHVERRGRTTVAVDGGTGIAALASFDTTDPPTAAAVRVLQLHVFVEADGTEGPPAADARPVFHIVATWPVTDVDAAGWGDALVALVTSAEVRRGRPSTRR